MASFELAGSNVIHASYDPATGGHINDGNDGDKGNNQSGNNGGIGYSGATASTGGSGTASANGTANAGVTATTTASATGVGTGTTAANAQEVAASAPQRRPTTNGITSVNSDNNRVIETKGAISSSDSLGNKGGDNTATGVTRNNTENMSGAKNQGTAASVNQTVPTAGTKEITIEKAKAISIKMLSAGGTSVGRVSNKKVHIHGTMMDTTTHPISMTIHVSITQKHGHNKTVSIKLKKFKTFKEFSKTVKLPYNGKLYHYKGYITGKVYTKNPKYGPVLPTPIQSGYFE